MGIVRKCPADLNQALRQRVVRDCGLWPNHLDQLILRHHTAIPFDQIPQNLERLGLKRDFLAVPAQETTVNIQDEVMESKSPALWLGIR